MAADETVKFGVDLDASGATRGAADATAALSRLDEQIADDTASIAAMQRALKNLQGGSAVNIQQFKQLKDRIDAKKVSIAQAQSKYVELGGTFKKLKKPTAEAAGGIEELLGKLKASGGPLGQMGGKLSSLGPLLAAGPWIALAAAVAAVTVALIAGTAALVAYGVSAANAYRNEKLMLDGLVAMPNWFGRAAGKADELQAAITKISANNPLARGEISGLAAEMYRAGLRGNGLTMALEGVATAQAGGGAQAAAYYKSIMMGAGRSSAAIKKFADDAKARFGGIAAGKMLDLNVQFSKLKESIDSLFTGLKIEPMLKALNSITELFSQNTASGRALKTIVEALLQPLIDSMGKTGPLAKRFFQGMVLAALDLTIAILRVRLWFRKTFGDSEILGKINGVKMAIYGGAFAFGFLATAATIASAAIVAAIVLAGMPFVALAAAISLPIYGVYKLIGLVRKVPAMLRGADWSGAGRDLVAGFVRGITLGLGDVAGAVKQMGATAIAALRQALDSHSPSKAFEKGAKTAPDGAVVAFRKGMGPVARASHAMGQAANDNFREAMGSTSITLDKPGVGVAPAGSTPKAQPQPATGGNVSVTIEYHPEPGTGTQQQVQEMRELILREFTGVALAVGAPLKAAG